MLVTYDCHSIKRWSIYPTKTTFKILTMRWQFIEPWNWLINFVVSHRNEEPTGDRIRTDICFANTTFFFFLYRFEIIRNIFSKLHRVTGIYTRTTIRDERLSSNTRDDSSALTRLSRTRPALFFLEISVFQASKNFLRESNSHNEPCTLVHF